MSVLVNLLLGKGKSFLLDSNGTIHIVGSKIWKTCTEQHGSQGIVYSLELATTVPNMGDTGYVKKWLGCLCSALISVTEFKETPMVLYLLESKTSPSLPRHNQHEGKAPLS